MKQISDNIWYVDDSLKRFPTVFNIRMVIVKLPSGGLWLHSPIPIDESLQGELNKLGSIEHIVAPSCFHHMFAKDAKDLFPNTVLWASPGLPKKRKDVEFDAVLTEKEAQWDETIGSEYIQGMPWINETVFLHKPSKTLICSDFVFNINEEESLFMKLLWKFGGVYKKFGQSREWRWMIRNVFDNVDSVNRILKWEFERIVMAHGDIIDCTNAQLFDVIKNRGRNFYT